MPFGGLLSLGSGLVGVGSSLAGLFGGGGTPASQVPTYSYANMGGADQGAYGGIGNLSNYNIGANYLPTYQSLVSNLLPQNNPYAQSYINNAASTGQAGMNSGAALTQAGLSGIPGAQGLTNSSLSLMPDVQSLINLGFDPQNAMYAKLQNQNQQQNAAILGNSGVASTPYGAGVMADANTNFNLGWQNQALQRAATGAGAAGGLLGNITNGANTGTNMLGSLAGLTGTGLSEMERGGALPYQAYTGVNTGGLSALSGAGQFGNMVSSIPQTSISDYLSYLSGGTQQQGANLNQANSSFNQSQALGAGLGRGLSQLGTGWNNAFGGGGGMGNWSMTGGQGPWNFPMAA